MSLERTYSRQRCSLILSLIGFWSQLLKDSNSFASYLSAYSVFLSSIIGVMIANYWVVSGRKVKVDDLYTMA